MPDDGWPTLLSAVINTFVLALWHTKHGLLADSATVRRLYSFGNDGLAMIIEAAIL